MFIRCYYVPSNILNALCVVSCNLKQKQDRFYYSHFTEEGIKAQQGDVKFPK